MANREACFTRVYTVNVFLWHFSKNWLLIKPRKPWSPSVGCPTREWRSVQQYSTTETDFIINNVILTTYFFLLLMLLTGITLGSDEMRSLVVTCLVWSSVHLTSRVSSTEQSGQNSSQVQSLKEKKESYIQLLSGINNTKHQMLSEFFVMTVIARTSDDGACQFYTNKSAHHHSP